MKNPPRLRQKGRAYYYDHGGKPRKWEALGSDRARALARWAEIQGGVSNGDTVGSLVDLFMSRKTGLAENTLKSYRNSAKIIKAVAGKIPKDQIRQRHMKALIQSHPSKQMARNAALFLKTVYAWAVSEDEIAYSPLMGMRLEGQSHRDRYLTHDEFIAVRDKLSPKYQVAADLAYLLGLRVSEVVKLKFSDFKDGVVTINQQKTKKSKYQEISVDVETVLERARTLPGSIRGFFLVSRRDGKPMAAETVSDAFNRGAKRAGIPNARFHDIRAKSASDDELTAQARLGHARAETTRLYLRKPKIVTPIKGIL